MFKSQYQGGSYVEVFSAQGRDPVSQWKLTGSVKKEYDKSLKGYVYRMEGGNSTTSTRMQLPKNEKQSLGLVQRYLVVQLSVPSSGRLALELTVMDGAGCRRRIQLSSSLRELSSSPLNARVPLSGVLLIDQWVNVCIDVVSMVTGLFKGQSFKSLEGINIGGSCCLRRVFTMRAPPPDTTDHTHLDDDVMSEEIPHSCQLHSSTIQTQVLSYSRLTESSTSSESSASRDVNSSLATSRPTHVAFGRNVAIPQHILSSRHSARGVQDRGRQTTGSRSRDSGIEGVGLQPRPPTGPVDPSLLRIQKKRVRMLHSGGRGRGQDQLKTSGSDTSTAVKDSGYGTVESSDVIMTSPPRIPPIEGNTSKDSSLLSDFSEQGQAEFLASDQGRAEFLASDQGRAEFLASDQGRAEFLASEQGQAEFLASDQGQAEFLASEQGQAEFLASDQAEVSGQGEDELDQSTLQELLYSFHSLPKSATAGGRRQANQSHTLPVDTSVGRGATLEEDFVLPGNDSSLSKSANEQGFPLSDESALVHPVLQSRLSDDYDWRLYASRDSDSVDLEESLRTRLAGGEPAAMMESTPQHSNSSEMEGTLSGSMTLSSGWTERYKRATHAPIYDSLDTRGMGGMMSPAMGTLTDQSDLSGEGEELELMYDPQLNCYYDPITYKYYELAQ